MTCETHRCHQVTLPSYVPVVCHGVMDSAYDSRQSEGMSSNGERLGAAVRARRAELDVTQIEVYLNVSQAVWKRFSSRSGRAPREVPCR